MRNLGLDALDVVNLRLKGPADNSIEASLSVLANLKQQGLVRQIGLSNITAEQFEQGEKITDIVCVQIQYKVAHREDDKLINTLAAKSIAYVPFFPLGAFSPLQSSTLESVANALGIFYRY